ncbi:MAG: fimbrillin family protein [Paludibacteraceae bacterium]|nr:fimbrillin family protein [Paludibacteraceae bacterium]
MNKTLLIAFASAFALGSCTNNEIDTTSGTPNGGIPINISTYVPRATRTYVASSNDIWNLYNEGFTFVAMNDSSNLPHIASTTFYVKDTDTGECGDWDGTQFFWPGDSVVSFYAVYPTASDDSESGRTWLYAANDSLVFTQDGREDVLAAYASGNASSTDGSVQLNFKHVSAKVALAACCDNADYNYALTSVVLTAPTKASYKFSTQKISVVADADSAFASIDSTYNEIIDVNESAVIFDSLMIAADGTAGSTCRLDVSYKTTITIGDSEIERTYTKSATVNIIAGYENTVSMKLAGDTPLSISVVANGWTADNEIDANGHEYIDLGLPSGTLWATCNIGAESSEDYGDYFAWGETETKETFTWDNYAFGKESELTKYCNNADCGTVDNLLTLEAEDDAAVAKWGGDWKVPTYEIFKELYDNCERELTTQNDVKGCLFTSKTNGNTLFLPIDADISSDYGMYWTSSLNTTNPNGAWYLIISFDATLGEYCVLSDYYSTNYNSRMCMQAIRPVIPGNTINF